MNNIYEHTLEQVENFRTELTDHFCEKILDFITTHRYDFPEKYETMLSAYQIQDLYDWWSKMKNHYDLENEYHVYFLLLDYCDYLRKEYKG